MAEALGKGPRTQSRGKCTGKGAPWEVRGAVTREPREPRLGMDSPTPPTPSPTSPGFTPPCCCCWESHRIALAVTVEVPASSFIKQPPSVPPPPRSLPGFCVRRWVEHAGVELHIGNNLFPQPVSLNSVLQMRNLGLRDTK